MILYLLLISPILGDQAVIQYDKPEHAHIPSPENGMSLEKSLVMLPQLSHEVTYLGNAFRRDTTSTNQAIKPVTEISEDTPAPNAPIYATLLQQQPPPKNIFSGLNLNYQIPSYSTPADFQKSVNTLTHLMINKHALQQQHQQQDSILTNYVASPLASTESPQQIKEHTVNKLVSMLVSMDKQNKQADMLSQIIQFMHMKRLQDERQKIISKLEGQMQKEQYKPLIENTDQAQGLTMFMNKLLLEQQHQQQQQDAGKTILKSVPPEDWTPIGASSTISTNAVYPGDKYFSSGHLYPSVAPTAPTFFRGHAPSSAAAASSSYDPDEGYVIRLSKPSSVVFNEDLPHSTSIPFTRFEPSSGQHHVDELNYQPKNRPNEYNPKEQFEPKFEHYVMKHESGNSNKQKLKLIKLKEEHKFTEPIHAAGAHYESFQPTSYDVPLLPAHTANEGYGEQQHTTPQQIADEIVSLATKYENLPSYDFIPTKNGIEPVHPHFQTGPHGDSHQQQGVDHDFLKIFDHVHYKQEDNIETIPYFPKGGEKGKRPPPPPLKKPPPPQKAPAKGPHKLVLLKVTRHEK